MVSRPNNDRKMLSLNNWHFTYNHKQKECVGLLCHTTEMKVLGNRATKMCKSSRKSSPTYKRRSALQITLYPFCTTLVILFQLIFPCFECFLFFTFQSALNFLDIFSRWKIFRDNTTLNEHISDCGIILHVFLLYTHTPT